MSLEFLNDFIVPLTLVVCICVGYIIKTSLDFIPNKYIPLIMGEIGVIFNIFANNWHINPTAIAGGLLTGLASTGLYETFRNFIEKK